MIIQQRLLVRKASKELLEAALLDDVKQIELLGHFMRSYNTLGYQISLIVDRHYGNSAFNLKD